MNQESIFEGRIALILVIVMIVFPFLFQTIRPNRSLDLASFVIMSLSLIGIAVGIGLGISSIRHLTGKDKVCGIIACVLACLLLIVGQIIPVIASARE